MKKFGQFIEKKKQETRFKRAGTGHSLQEERQLPQDTSSSAPVRTVPSQSSQTAGQKALERLEQAKVSAKPRRDLSVLKSQVKQDVEEQAAAASTKKQKQNQSASAAPTFHDQDSPVSVAGIFYQCPICNKTDTQNEMTPHMEECILTKLVSEDPVQGTCAMINSLNKDFEKLKVGKDTLCKYIDNVCNNDGEEKYCKIRVGNKAFQERVLPLKGVSEFLQAVGFQQKEIPHQDVQELFWVLPEEFAKDTERLLTCKGILLSAETIRPTLSRDRKILRAAKGGTLRFHLPNEFFRITAEESKKEQERRKDMIEKSEQLRTKAMKESDERNEKRKYRYSLIRVRFPDGYVLQGTFHARDKFSEVIEFVRSCLVNDWQPFILSDPTRPLLDMESKSLLQLKLAPAAQLTFAWDPKVMAEVTASQGSTEVSSALNPELLASCETL